MMDNVTVAFLWHFHQPIYYAEIDHPASLPWVRLHALKDYRDMLSYIDEFPELKLTFNFTPSLLHQLAAYADGTLTDRFCVLAQKPASTVTIDERIEILRNFFLANPANMIQPYPRYHSLLLKRGTTIDDDELLGIARRFSDQEITDLQVWFNLTWLDPSLRTPIKHLYDRGHGFTEADKQALFDYQKRIIAAIIPAYRKASEAKRIEITTSPYFHPIMPLVIDSAIAVVSNPQTRLPESTFREPDDCRQQLASGIELFEHCFAQKPKGLWPSEGSVSEAIVPLVKELGIDYVATDEAILARSLGIEFSRDEHGVPGNPDTLYRSYIYDGLKFVFRDHLLSDLIGFAYHAWPADQAAEDFIRRLKAISRALPPDRQHIIPIILDGENAWESYPDDGWPFLKALYSGLTQAGIATTTLSDFLAQDVPEPLGRVFPGSWIEGNFNTWIGHAEKNRAWDMLARVRTAAAAALRDPDIARRIHLLEGSDWYWWFGTGHSFATAAFDQLFRHYVRSIYARLGLEVPPDVDRPIVASAAKPRPPIDLVRPKIDGRVTNYYEWSNAGMIDLVKVGGTMHRSAGFFTKIYYGFDEKNIFLRVDSMHEDLASCRFRVDFTQPVPKSFLVGENPDVSFAAGEIVEIAIPFSALGPSRVGRVNLTLGVSKDQTELDRSVMIDFDCTPGAIDLEDWSA